MKYVVIFLVVVMLLSISCAPRMNLFEDVPREGEGIAGFWLGLWHGMIAFFTFLFSLFYESVSIYEVHNCGGWYDFGFILEAGASSGSGCMANKHK